MPATPPPGLVGRGAEFAVLTDAFSEGRQGHARAVVIRGEAGVGKTRLLRDFAGWVASESGGPQVVIATGQCVEQGEIGAPFTPLRRLLWDLYGAVGDESFRAAAGSPAIVGALAGLLPELARADAVEAPAAALDFLSDAVSRLLEGLSRDHHVVVIMEDLHWADGATLSLLRSLALTLRGHHLTLIATYRSDDVGRGHPLRAALADFERNRAVATLEVRRLTVDEVAALVETITGAPPDRATVEALAARSEGVPFYVEELVAVGSGQLPETLRDVVLARYERLDEPVQRVARTIAVAGARVDDAVLGAAWGGERSALDDGLRAAIADGLLVTDDSGYAFRHALMQEAIYGELLPSERATLHGAFAQAYQDRVDAGQLVYAAEAAEHWLSARDIERALLATVAARRHALSSYAPATAALLGERILELWPQVPHTADHVGLTATALRVEIATQLLDASETKAADRVARRGLELSEPSEVVDRARLEEVLATTAAELTGRAAAVEHFQAVERLLADTVEPVGRATLARATAALASLVLSDESEAKVRGTIEFGMATDDWAMVSYANRRLVEIYFGQGRPDAAAEAMRNHLTNELPTDPSCDRYRADSTVAFADTLVRIGGYEEALAHCLDMFAVTEQLGVERGIGASLLANAADAAAASAQPDRAIEFAHRTRELFGPDATFWMSFAYRVELTALVWDDRLDEAAALIATTTTLRGRALDADSEEAAGWTAPLIVYELARAETARGAARKQHHERALELALVLEREDLLEGPVYTMMAVPWAAMAVAQAEGLDAARQRAAIAACLSLLPTDGWMVGPRGFISACLDPSADAWARSAQWSGLPPALSRWALLQHGRRLADAGERSEAIAVLSSLADDPRCVRLVARLARSSLAGLVGERGTGPLAELTGRELEVLELVAHGLSNGDIGKRLFISTKTASVHVSAILSKLGAANRAEAAAVFALASGEGPKAPQRSSEVAREVP